MASKRIDWLTEPFQTPPFGDTARRRLGFLLREVQDGETLSMPTSRPLPQVSARVHELRVKDAEARATWRVIYRIDDDAIVVVHAYDKNTDQMPRTIVNLIRGRLRDYDRAGR